ncbi:type I DNA topoisomerase [Acidobacteria bacterium AH-259-L09]|nr:type I DNA topoisomerase [Acidobacteria bacterium AH-259-L09]
MPKAMVIVESPAKARTIEKYLGKRFEVRACAGHIKDLPERALGVDIKDDFRPTYRVISGKKKIVDQLKKEAQKSEEIYLAADPDREGEAICQHLAEELNGTQDRRIYRILFNEITKNTILNAFKNPSSIDQNKVQAQQARRILDRLVGYKVSPLLWQKVRSGLSAGRVQTVALRMIVERELEIRGFVPEEYWNFTARLKAKTPPPFEAKAVKHKGKKFKISNQEEADKLLEELRAADFVVSGVKKKKKKRNPVPAFITSKLQQEASRKLKFPIKKTMRLAQRLYEGVQVGDEGRVGLITYMRTDSTRVADSALAEVREYLKEIYGEEYLPSKAVLYRGKKGAQDAHEAIRPTSVLRQPEQVKPFLDRDEYRLYELIWKRFVASQMTPAVFDQTEIEIDAARTKFKAVGTVMKFDGFLKLYQEGRDDGKPAPGEDGKVLPEVTKGEKLQVEKIVPEQKFTQPPARYSEATLVKALEEKGIGRPSTYVQILSVIMDRDYVKKGEGRFVPTEVGEVVIELLVHHFEEIFDYDYTAKLERDLDEIENGKEHWVHTLREFYAEFSKELQQARREMKNLKKEEVPAGIQCEKCGGEMVIRWGRFGRFIACSNYPECKNTRELQKESSSLDQEDAGKLEKELCEQCGRPMVLRRGRYGEFLACSGYPECKNTKKVIQAKGEMAVQREKSLDEKCPQCGSQLVRRHGRYGEFVACSNYPDCRYVKQQTTGVTCPQCGNGELVRRKSRRGKFFYGCSAFPKCNFVLWQKPVDVECPSCGAAYLLERITKKEGVIHSCNNSECHYKEIIEPVAAG